MKTTFVLLMILLASLPVYLQASYQPERLYLSKLIKEIDYLMKPINTYCTAYSNTSCKYRVLLSLLQSVRAGIIQHIEADNFSIQQLQPLRDDLLIKACRNMTNSIESERIVLTGVISDLDKLSIRLKGNKFPDSRYTFKYQYLQDDLLTIRSAIAKCVEINLYLPRDFPPMQTPAAEHSSAKKD